MRSQLAGEGSERLSVHPEKGWAAGQGVGLGRTEGTGVGTYRVGSPRFISIFCI